MTKHPLIQRMGILLVLVVASGLGACSRPEKSVVVYTALDRHFSEPIFQRFERETGIKVLPKYDTESTKTVGLVNALIAEADHPRCDVFWNNEIVNTIRLKNKGLLQPCAPSNAQYYEAHFKDPDGYWYGFAARARVILYNTQMIAEAEAPVRVADLAKPALAGKCGIAKPLFGTTATHVSCLFAVLGAQGAQEMLLAMKNNGIHVESGNKTCAVKVGQGILAAALTDTDDAIEEVRAGSPVALVFPDQGEDELGALMIPNTLSLVRDCPHPEAGQQLIDYLLSPEIEQQLSQGESAQIPLNNTFAGPHALGALPRRTLAVDFGEAAALFDQAAAWINDSFL